MIKKTKKSDDFEERKQAEKISMKEGSSYSVMDGFGLRYITPYALAIGASNIAIGILGSLPSLLGNLAQLPILKLTKRVSRKKIVFTSVLFQAILWLPIIFIGFLYFVFKINSSLATILFIFSYTLMIVSGTIAGPPWNSWMKDIVKEKSGSYFGKRNRVNGFVAILSLLAAGIILNYFGKQAFTGFLIIFFIACLGRFFSAYLLKKQYEPKFKFEDSYYFNALQFIKKMSFNNFGRFVIFVSLISFATAIASPFFAVYMLKDLNFSYLSFTFVILIPAVSAIIFMPFWGRFTDKFGNVKALKSTGIFIPLIPFFWLVTLIIIKINPNLIIPYLLITETFSGFIWSGFNLSAANFIYDAVTRQRMALCVAYFNLLNAFGIFIGAILGGLIASQKTPIMGIRPLIFVFILSGFLRLIFAFIFRSFIKEVRPVEKGRIVKHLKEEIKYTIGSRKTQLKKYLGFKSEEINAIKE